MDNTVAVYQGSIAVQQAITPVPHGFCILYETASSDTTDTPCFDICIIHHGTNLLFVSPLFVVKCDSNIPFRNRFNNFTDQKNSIVFTIVWWIKVMVMRGGGLKTLDLKVCFFYYLL